MIEINSQQNQRYKNWFKLLDGRGIKKQEQALVMGRSFIGEILSLHPERVQGVIVGQFGKAAKSFAPDGEILAEAFSSLPGSQAATAAVPPGCPVYLLPPDLFAALDIYGIKAPILLISAPPPPAWDGSLPPGLTVFIPFQNPINLGTTIRSAAAFGASAVLLREAASPYLPKCLRASGPSIFQIPLFQGPGLQELAEVQLPIFALSPKGENIFRFDFPETAGLVAGLEGPGLDAYWPHEKRLSIPMRPLVESLNASVSMSIAMALQARCAERTPG